MYRASYMTLCTAPYLVFPCAKSLSLFLCADHGRCKDYFLNKYILGVHVICIYISRDRHTSSSNLRCGDFAAAAASLEDRLILHCN